MHMATPQKLWTVDEVQALPDDGNRYEVVDGELLVTPAPSWRHATASKLLLVRLHAYATGHGVGRARSALGRMARICSMIGSNIKIYLLSNVNRFPEKRRPMDAFFLLIDIGRTLRLRPLNCLDVLVDL